MTTSIYMFLNQTTGTPELGAYFVTELDAKKYMYAHGMQGYTVVKPARLTFDKPTRKRA